MPKTFTSELVNEVGSGCQQFHRGMGYMPGDRAILARKESPAQVLDK